MRLVVTPLKWLAVVVVAVLATVLAVRAWQVQQGPPLRLWHTFAPHELDAAAIDRTDWKGYLAAEAAAFDEVRREVTQKLPDEDRVPANRYFDGAPMYPGRFAQDWNRSFVLTPSGPPVGAVVLLHGLTDSPYSSRHVAQVYRDAGFVAVAIRLPGHGTVPGGLARVHWQDWSAATRLAVREAVRQSGPGKPLHLVGYSNGGALATKYALEALDDPALPQPTRVVLLSPMIGITAMARFAGVLGWPAVLPAFAKAAWLGIVPEFNPFKFNSFPVNAARQSSLVAAALQEAISRRAKDGGLAGLPPVLTFQSVVDFTVSTRAIVDALYAAVPKNGSELVLFDLNRNVRYGPLLAAGESRSPAQLLPPAPRSYAVSVVTNAGPDTREVVERRVDAGSADERVRALGLAFPTDVFSLSHIALPFPVEDGLYGLAPDLREDFGVRLGALAPRGERGALVVSVDALTRLQSNPFMPYLLDRVREGIAAAGK